jgi:TfoX/Sxy family transcriptional regulator of competence genes
MPTARSSGKAKPASPGWKKAPEDLARAFDLMAAGHPDGVRRMMFGYPCLFVKGQMAAGLFQDDVFVRLGEPDRAAVVQLGGRPFEPVPGRPMRQYVILPKEIVASHHDLGGWVARAAGYAASLPPKVKARPRRAG